MEKYLITENLDDRPAYKGQALTVKHVLNENYLILIDENGTEWLAGEEELKRVTEVQPFTEVTAMSETDFETLHKRNFTEKYLQGEE